MYTWLHISTFVAILLAISPVINPTRAEIIDVPDDFGTIQGAIDDGGTASGDTILVEPGTYVENIDFDGKDIVIIGDPEDPSSVIIDGNDSGPVVNISNGETLAAKLTGFTIQNGLNAGALGGGIRVHGASATLTHLIIKDNEAEVGGGIQHQNGPLVIEDCLIFDNIATSTGGGASIYGNALTMSNVSIYDNVAAIGGGLKLENLNGSLDHLLVYDNESTQNHFTSGGGLSVVDCNLDLVNCTIADNIGHASGAGGITLNQASFFTSYVASFRNCIIWDNTGVPVRATHGGGFGTSTLNVDYTDMTDGEDGIVFTSTTINWGDGNIEDNPEFVDADIGDYHLTFGSPCIDTGDPAGAYDDPDDTRNDMGAYYFDTPPVPPTVAVTFPNGGQALPVLDVANITWTASEGSGDIDTIIVYYSHDSLNWVALDTLPGNAVSFAWTVPVERDLTVWIKVFVKDENDLSAFDVSNSPFGIGPRREAFSFPDGWALISLPLIPDLNADAIEQIIGDDVEHRYVVYGFENDQGFFDADTLAHGKGYFLGFDEFDPPNDHEFDVIGMPVTEDSVHLELDWGWNVICTPFRSTVDLAAGATFWHNGQPKTYLSASNALLIHPPVFSFTNEGHIIDDDLDPWRAYWFLTLVPGMSVTVYPTAPHPAPPRDGGDEGSEDNWSINFSATLDGFTDTGRMGVLANATDGFDNRFDFAEPPTPPVENFVRVCFDHGNWNAPVGSLFERDIRAPMQRGETDVWVLSVIPSRAGEVTLNWGDLDAQVHWRNSYLLIDGETRVDMREVNSYTFQADGEKQLTLFVHSALEAPPAESITPTSFGIASVSPNPFNNRAKVSFGLAQAGDVSLSVIDMMGRSVMTLAKGDFASGSHTVAIDAEGLAGGTYLVRLESAGQVSTANLTLIK